MHWCAVPWVSWAIEMAVAVPFAAKGLLSVVDPRVVRWASDLGPKSDSLRDSLVCPTFMCQQKYTILEHCWDIGSLLSSAIYSFTDVCHEIFVGIVAGIHSAINDTPLSVISSTFCFSISAKMLDKDSPCRTRGRTKEHRRRSKD